jgi:hypothetical protein
MDPASPLTSRNSDAGDGGAVGGFWDTHRIVREPTDRLAFGAGRHFLGHAEGAARAVPGNDLSGRIERSPKCGAYAGRHRPALNLIVSSVPGPDFPLYFAGATLLALYRLGSIYEGMGLNVTVLSYLDVVGFGFVSCRELAPDLSELAGAVSESLRELEKEAVLSS